ncbi:Hypothetical protein POVR1_LOCUS343 [uncultured virus]|nr:Hypothetical protein POVR1_LOCUS343 [uncultured virus]
MIVAKIRSQPLFVAELLELLLKKEDNLVCVKCLYDQETRQFELLDPEIITVNSYAKMTGVEVNPASMNLQIILADMALELLGCCTVPFTEITRSKTDPTDLQYEPIFKDMTFEEGSVEFSSDSTGSQDESSSEESVIGDSDDE